MYGLDINVDDVTLEPIEIGDTVYVPYHASNGTGEITTFVEYEQVSDLLDGDDDDEDFRIDGDLR